jgi:Flp pilus assembly protein TadG
MTMRRILTDESGVAAVEFALVGSLLVGALFNVAEVSRYTYLAIQVSAASQAGAQGALVACDTSHVPATINCPGVLTAVTTALHSTSLGDDISVVGALQEDWFCVNAQGALQVVGDAAHKPTNCAAAGDASAAPGLYLRVNVTYHYEAMFPGLTIAEAFPANITRSAWMRMG